jgi:PAS domain S-box-containing protein
LRRSGLERASVALHDAMKDYGLSANVVLAGQDPQAESLSAQRPKEAQSGISGEQDADELATALAIMQATLESTTDAILVTDEANYVREFNEKYVKFWGIPPHMMISAHASELWNYTSRQLKDPGGYLAEIHEIIASSPPETFDVLQLKDGRVFERNSAIQLIKQRNVGRVWSFRDITQRKRAQDALANEKRVLQEIASGAPLATVLDVLVRGVEAQSCDGMMCTVWSLMKQRTVCATGRRPACPQNTIASWTACASVRVLAHVAALLTNANLCLRWISPPIHIGPTTLSSLRRSGSAPAVRRQFSPAKVRCWELLPCIIAIRTNRASTIES